MLYVYIELKEYRNKSSETNSSKTCSSFRVATVTRMFTNCNTLLQKTR